MQKIFRLVIACKHKDPSNIFKTQEGEHVCKCGVVVEEKLADEAMASAVSTPSSSQNNISLYHKMETGGDPKDMKVINKKIHVHTSTTSEFSNICNKLQMSNFIEQRAWKIYQLLRNKTHYTRAKCAAFSVYIACREGGQAINEKRIKSAIRSVLCVKTVPNMLNVISEMHYDALHIGINTNTGHSPKYYLNLAISKKQRLFENQAEYDKFKICVIDHFNQYSGNHQNKVNRAIQSALEEMGLV